MARGLTARERATSRALRRVHADIRALRLPGLCGPPIHGPPIASRIFLLGQAPGPHEGRFGRPFAWTAGKTLFSWFERACGASEEDVRSRVYIAAVVRCFPGKTAAGGDRLPSEEEIAAYRPFVARELEALRPRLVLPVGRLAIAEVLGEAPPLAEVVGRTLRVHLHGREVDVIPLPHPSGASTWFKLEPGKTLLARALRALGRHPEVRAAFPRARSAR
ncbi:MAG TPA: uracil-DNA glycosylase family protein [Anaeromyxobacteraceae bacterium]|nr:uracil-DNA glycosylase family protein [Anaeromyxobacteraceae bacterium]